MKNFKQDKRFLTGKDHPLWNWDTKNYASIHRWLKSEFGKAIRCENPGCAYKNTKRFEWALLKGKEYARKRENFWMLCKSCHFKYDITKERNKKVSTSLMGNKNASAKGVPIVAYKNGLFIESFNKVSHASKKLKINIGNVSSVLSGKRKTAGGYTFKYV